MIRCKPHEPELRQQSNPGRPPDETRGNDHRTPSRYLDQYRRLHVDGYPGVRDLLSRYQLRNFSIFLHNVAGRWLEFGYYEYHGEDFEADMAALAAEPRNQEWLVRCDPMQAPLDGETGWSVMERVYFNA